MCQGILFTSYCAKDVLHDCLLLDARERLAYLSIYNLILASGNRLPDDDKSLARLTMAGRRFPRIKEKLIAEGLIVLRDGFVTNPRCDEAIARSEHNLAQKIDAGLASAKKRKPLKDNNTGSTDVITDVPTNLKPLNKEEEAGSEEQPASVTETSSPTKKTPPPKGSSPSEADRVTPAAALSAARDARLDAEFREWYATYPVHKAPQQARRAYLRARKEAPGDTLLAGARQAAADRQKRLDKGTSPEMASKHPATWLNGGCWDDDPEPEPRYRSMPNSDGNTYVDYGGM
jgi:uncharacterized protein YdaU (DUF1376 family)